MLDLGDPGARIVQALEQIDRPLMGGLVGEHPGEGLVQVAHEEGDRPAAVGVGAQRLRQGHDVRRLEVETGAGHLDDLGESAHPGISQLLCRSAHFLATDCATCHNRDEAMERRYLHIDRHALQLDYRASESATIGAVDGRSPIFHQR
ncbi:MAG: hypothetical protein GEV13_00600 [Rhodospirillales bacterium]|nr:hypothetical protein [Rhodospirillales bacterium]